MVHCHTSQSSSPLRAASISTGSHIAKQLQQLVGLQSARRSWYHNAYVFMAFSLDVVLIVIGSLADC